MIRQIFLYEINAQFRALSFYITFLAMAGLGFLLTANGSEFQATAVGGEVYANAPAKITLILIVLSVFSTFIAPSFCAHSVIKDFKYGFSSILFSTPLGKKSHLIGRFLASFVAFVVAMSALPLALYMGTLWPWADPNTLGQVAFIGYWYVFFVIVVPSLFVISSLIFAISALTKKIIYAYLMAMLILSLYILGSESNAITALFDPFMHEIFEKKTSYWTAIELNSQWIKFDQEVLSNRLFWIVVSLLFLYFSINSFKLTDQLIKQKKQKSNVISSDSLLMLEPITHKVSVKWTNATEFRQFIVRLKFEVVSVIRTYPFILLISLSTFVLVMNLISQETYYGVKAYPLTRLMVQSLTSTFLMTLLAVLAFYSAEVIWRERESKIHELIDALPAANWIFVLSKVSALLMIMLSIMFLGVVIAVIIQFFGAKNDMNLFMYLHRGVIYPALPFLYLAILTCFFQVLARSRYLGFMFFAVFITFIITFSDVFGFSHPLFSYGIPGMYSPLSDMNGNGRFIEAGYVLRTYWAFIAAFIFLMTYVLWNRGVLQPFRFRISALSFLINRRVVLMLSMIFFGMLSSGIFIYYNTNVLNEFLTEQDTDQLRYTYEKKYKDHMQLPMPRTVDIFVEVDLYPHQRRIETRSSHTLLNKTNQPINRVYVTFPSATEVVSAEIEDAELLSIDDEFNYYEFELSKAMYPEEVRTLKYELIIQQKGFVHESPDVTLVRNGTFIRNTQLAPYIGFNPRYRLIDQKKRQKWGLPKLEKMPLLENTLHYSNSAIRADSDFIKFKAQVSTVGNQSAIAPGSLKKQWVNNGRNYYLYEMNAPIRNFYSFLSAEYSIVEEHWQGVDIKIYHHQTHDFNLSSMFAGVKDSLDYFNQAFSPYQYEEVNIVEFPSYRKFAQAFPTVIPYSEDMGFISHIEKEDLNMPYYVTAHEMAHQWWGHQVAASENQGKNFIHETLAQYSALMVMEKKYGQHKIRQFLKYELDKYLSERSNDGNGELPLLRVEKQSYIYYRKGAGVMYALKDYLGEEVINRALRKLLALKAYKSDPYTISTDFIDLLKQEVSPSLHGFIDDSLTKITFYDMQLSNAQVRKVDNNQYEVTLDVEADKLYATPSGKESRASFDMAVDIVLFAKHPDEKGFSETDIIFIKKYLLKESQETIVLTTSVEPAYAGIDPYHKLIDRNIDDNINKVSSVK